MEVVAFPVIAGIWLILTLFNEFIVWKLWPRCAPQDFNIRRDALRSSLFIDPLVATIVCPMASDIYFTLTWAMSCELFFVITITAVSLILYTSSLIVTYKIVAVMNPRATCFSSEKPKVWTNASVLSFWLSVAMNAVLTLITLSLTTNSNMAADFFQAENCWNSVLKSNVLFIFVLCLSMQTIHVLFYSHLSECSVISHKSVIYDHQGSNTRLQDIELQQEIDDKKYVRAYSLTALFCLSMANLLRFSYTVCSCHSYLLLASSLYYTNWLVVVKLPCAGMLYWTISTCQRKLQ